MLEGEEVLILAEADILAKVAGASRANRASRAAAKLAAKPAGRSARRPTK